MDAADWDARGRELTDRGDLEGAEAAFSRVLDLDNENVIALKSLADIMERQGRSDEAISFLTYLLDVDRSNDEAREQ
ncbi:MAG TPA: tetratricopeptide repeat protein, partial [Spirochaetia bacterium]|nr:tetratricopeptide repeat protein [Spirochaetia bacterium]